jgi:small subunit ribosomal protein S15
MLTAEAKLATITEYGKSKTDTGSTAAQIALLTARITELTGHLQEHRKDRHGERGLRLLVSKRRRLLNYLAKTDEAAYQGLIKKLKLRR